MILVMQNSSSSNSYHLNFEIYQEVTVWQLDYLNFLIFYPVNADNQMYCQSQIILHIVRKVKVI